MFKAFCLFLLVFSLENNALGSAKSAEMELFKTNALFEKNVGLAARFSNISAGIFEMGSPDDETYREGDENLHTVQISKDFEMQVTPVTQLQYYYVTRKAPSSFNSLKYCDPENFKILGRVSLCSNHPVDNVSWNDAQKFVKELNKIQDQYFYRLPTEAEWEFAARGGRPSSFPYFFGFNDQNDLADFAWYVRNASNWTQKVAGLKPNPYGLYDMYGNVWQWVQDFYGPYSTVYAQNSTDTILADPKGAISGADRVLRGGAWNLEARFLRSAHRFFASPIRKDKHFGFRLVRTVLSLKR